MDLSNLFPHGPTSKLDALAPPDDTTTLDATTLLHGLLPKLSGSATEVLNGVGSWAVPAGGGDVAGPASAVDDRIATFNLATGKVIQDGGNTIADVLARANHTGTQLASTISDFTTQVTATKLDAFATPDDVTTLNATTVQHGLLPKLGGGTTNFFRADGTWAEPAGGSGNCTMDTTTVDTAVMIANGTDSTTIEDSVILNSSLLFDSIWIGAGALTPSITNGATVSTIEYATNDLTHDVMVFAGDTADTYAEFDVALPESWDLGTVKAKVFWTTGDDAANIGEYVGFYLAGGAFSDSDALDAALGSEVLIADQVVTDNDMHISAASGAITIGGTPALNDMIHLKLRRDYNYTGGGTAMDVDARVFGILIQCSKTGGIAAW